MNLEKYKKVIAAAALVGLLAVTGFIIKFTKEINDTSLQVNSITEQLSNKNKTELRTFSSPEEFEKKLAELQNNTNQRDSMAIGMAVPGSAPTSSKSFSNELSAQGSGAQDFSQTNIQVAGVDEADIMKTDGKYIYTVAKSYLTITLADPANDLQLMSKTELKNATPQELFIEGDNLMIFGRKNYPYQDVAPMREDTSSSSPSSAKMIAPEMYPYPSYSNIAFVQIYNISDHAKPELKRNVEFDGDYKTSRKIGSDVYFVLNNYPMFFPMGMEGKESKSSCDSAVPMYREGNDLKADSKMSPLVKCTDINYVNPITSAQYATVVGISIADYSKDLAKKVVMGGGENVYASEKSLYLARTNYDYPRLLMNIVPIQEPKETTQILKFKIGEGKIDFKNSGSVSGHTLNQFSMDEFEGNLRLATTIGHVSRSGEATSSNNLYILDDNLDRIGAIENIAPGEQIYSARFMGKRGFLVTFKKVDPFFTFDLSDPKNPKLVGKLKIPGYSDYLHPYDDNHIIGIGKNTVESSESLKGQADFAWYQGIKMAMFDVTDFENPKEMFKIEIGDRGTDSPILNDHKALLFSKEKSLLVIPILEAKLTNAQKKANSEGNSYGDYSYQGAYVFNVDLEKGFNLQGRVSHFANDDAFKKAGYYFGEQDFSIKRSLYIGNTLFSISDQKIMANDLSNLDKIKEVNFDLPKEENRIYY